MTDDIGLSEASSIRYNISRICRMSDGRFALFSHHRKSGIDLIATGTLAELEPLIPSAAECIEQYEANRQPPKSRSPAPSLTDLLGF